MVTGPIETLKEELVCLNTLYKNSFKDEQITSVFKTGWHTLAKKHSRSRKHLKLTISIEYSMLDV